TAHEQLLAEKKQQIDTMRETALAELPPPAGETVPEDVEKRLPEETQAALKGLRDELKKLEEAAPPMPTAMGVADGEVTDTAVHLRGSHLTLGEMVPRRFPRVLAGD